MFFLRHKKQKRDRGAGLVFRWRGAKRHHASKVYAFLLSAGFFSFAVYALRVEGLRSPLLTKRTGDVVLLNEGNPYCASLMLQIEERSPFPLRWDPAQDVETMGRIGSAAMALEGRVWDYRPALAEVPEPLPSTALPSVVVRGASLFDGLIADEVDGSEPEVRHPDLQDLVLSAEMSADASLQSVIPAGPLPLPRDLIADEWFGQSFRFLIGVDARGVVRGCLPLSGGNMEVAKPTAKQKWLAAWLRRTPFLASREPGGHIGVLEVEIKARQE
ncbi:hypothetical protein HW115_14825 [Verrucomicrobiaceae bacterium N1E253]|uniref:Uncharacterized protein n=1 Tax=Oceaniferula marina TaxID=2748318 RepID=A0A851GP44_9BACT|nr:hypothetical protein [Oceaniferula marina]NWK56895.1 hypothetical protein [Oceaniferula marina]